jgi:serine/threonine protein kinase
LVQHDKAERFMELHSSVGGTRLGHYQVLDQIGKGGMALVYRARDTRLGRLVALKVLPPWAVAHPGFRERLIREAKCASALNHPNIVTVHEIAQENGVDFIVMEFVSGKTLDCLIPSKGLSVPDTLHYAIQIADALTAAHAAGILHGDLKPLNIMVTDSERVKVLDFGLAKALASRQRHSGKAGHADPFGTKVYMAPEQQLRHQKRAPDRRSEIFSFGLILYEMLCGKHAFGPGTRDQISQAIRTKPPHPLRPKVPISLSAIVLRCLEKNPSSRFESMEHLVVALKKCDGSKAASNDAREKLKENTLRVTTRRAITRQIGYTNIAKSRQALAELADFMKNGAPPREREAVSSVLKDLILTVPDFNGNGVPASVREVRKLALDLVKGLAQGNLGLYFQEHELEYLDLYGMDFGTEQLSGLSFRGSFLVEANFQGSHLIRSSFRGAYIRNASFGEADLTHADLTDADWFNALGLTERQLRQVQHATLLACPPNVQAMHTYLQARYAFPFQSWSTRVQEELKTAWNEYLPAGGLRDTVDSWREKSH